MFNRLNYPSICHLTNSENFEDSFNREHEFINEQLPCHLHIVSHIYYMYKITITLDNQYAFSPPKEHLVKVKYKKNIIKMKDRQRDRET